MTTWNWLVSFVVVLLLPGAILWAQKPELVVQTGHSNYVTALALSSDGQWLASSSGDATVRIWQMSTGSEFRTLRGHSQEVNAVAFSRDNKLLASAGNDQNIILWDLETGRQLTTLKGVDEGFVMAVAFSPDGKTLASGGTDKTIRLWDFQTGRALRTLIGHGDEVADLAFSPDGSLLASAGNSDRSVKIWDAVTWKEVRTLSGSKGAASAVAFSPDGKTIAFGNNDTSAGQSVIYLRDVATGRDVRTLIAGTPYIFALAYSPDGRTLAAATEDPRVRLWEASTGKPLEGLAGHRDIAYSLAYTADGRLISGGYDGEILIWDKVRGRKEQLLGGYASPVNSIALSRDGTLLASGNGDRTLTLWRLIETQQPQRIAGLTNIPTAVAFSPDGKTLAAGTVDYEIRLWATDDGRPLLKFVAHEGLVSALAFSPDGRTLASGAFYEKNVKMWDVSTGRLLRTLSGHSGDINSISFSPDGRLLASADGAGLVRIWDAATGAAVRDIRPHDSAKDTAEEDDRPFEALGINSIAFSPDGKTLAAGGHTVSLIDVATGQVLRRLTKQQEPKRIFRSNGIIPVKFSSDGKILASGGTDGIISLWNTADGSLARTLSGHLGNISSLTFGSGDKTLFSASDIDATIRLWDPAAGIELAQLVSAGESEGLIVTPDGLFDGAPPAWQKIQWRFSPSLKDVSPVEIFFNEFFYPNLLADLLEGKRPVARRTITQRDRRQPDLSIASSDAGATTPNRTVTVRLGIADTGDGARDVRLFRNGSLVKVWRGDVLAGKTKTTLEAQIAIVAGGNRFTAYAFNRDNIKSRDAVMDITGSESVRHPATLYIFAVGVDHYANPAFDLKYAVADAQGLAAEVQRQQETTKRFARVENVKLLDTMATKQAFLTALENLSRKVQPEDAVFIFFAGHGLANEPRFYLIPHDLGYTGSRTAAELKPKLADIYAHGISDEELERALEPLDAGQIIFVIDACNSGQALEAEEKRRGPMNSQGLAQLAYEKGMYILTAAQSYQAALEAGQLGHGLLTYSLLEEGLKEGRADREPKDGNIVTREWFNYAAMRVPQLQLEKMQQARQLTQQLVIVDGDEKVSDMQKRRLQRPRIFYRREPESVPFVVGQRREE